MYAVITLYKPTGTENIASNNCNNLILVSIRNNIGLDAYILV